MSANSKQVGGNHYASSLQHWDVVENNGIGYLEGCASKYISRWRKKNGLQDLEKGLHYTEKLLELATYQHDGITPRRFPRGSVDRDTIERFVIANDLEMQDRVILYALWRWQMPHDLERAILLFKQLIDEVRNAEGKATTG